MFLYYTDTPEILQSDGQSSQLLSAINFLECVDILGVNVKEDTTEVVHSGHSTASIMVL